MTLKLQYHCKFCQREGVVQYEDNGVLSQDQVDYWLKHVACDRCAIYERSRRDLIHALYSVCGWWISVRDGGAEIKQRAHQRFENIIRKLCQAVEIFKCKDNIFDSTMVDDLIEKPNQANKVITRIIA
jgi:hypothetical protein